MEEPLKKRMKIDESLKKPHKTANASTLQNAIQERKNVLVKGATAIIASLGFLAAAN
jgi:hypothetical protein